MRRAAVFAHYNSKGTIEDYVIYYLKNLKPYIQSLVFVSDGEIKKEELKKIQAYTDKIIVKNHGEYDFGSYKTGYLFLKEDGILDTFDELIFLNDSCYAPLFSFEDFFKTMSSLDVDFWGNTLNRIINEENNSLKEHIQSYFIAFKKKVFRSEVFENFMQSVKKENTKEEVISKYEVGLSELLTENGFKYEVFCKISKSANNSHIRFYDKLISKDKSPFLKRNLMLLKMTDFQYPIFTRKLIKKTDYNYNSIKKDIDKNGKNLPRFLQIKLFLKALKRKIIIVHLKEKKVYVFGKEIALHRN